MLPQLKKKIHIYIRSGERQTHRSFTWRVRISPWGSFLSSVVAFLECNNSWCKENVLGVHARAGEGAWGKGTRAETSSCAPPRSAAWAEGVRRGLRVGATGWDSQSAVTVFRCVISRTEAPHFSYSPLEGCGAGYTHKSLRSKGNTRGLRSLPLKDGPRVSLRARVRISSVMLSHPCMKVAGAFQTILAL